MFEDAAAATIGFRSGGFLTKDQAAWRTRIPSMTAA